MVGWRTFQFGVGHGSSPATDRSAYSYANGQAALAVGKRSSWRNLGLHCDRICRGFNDQPDQIRKTGFGNGFPEAGGSRKRTRDLGPEAEDPELREPKHDACGQPRTPGRAVGAQGVAVAVRDKNPGFRVGLTQTTIDWTGPAQMIFKSVSDTPAEACGERVDLKIGTDLGHIDPGEAKAGVR